MTQINNHVLINEINNAAWNNDSPLWSDPRNVNTFSHGSLCLRAEITPHEKISSPLLTWRKALQSKTYTLKNVLHKLLSHFDTLNQDKNPSVCYNRCNKTKKFLHLYLFSCYNGVEFFSKPT